MAFDEVQFPTDISRGATSRPRRLTDVVTLRSGHEERNTIWANSRRSYNVGLGIRDLDDIYEVIEFWEARRGRLRGFRFKDWADFKSVAPNGTVTPTDQVLLSLGDGQYQLRKTYSPSSNPWTRTITKPVPGTVRVSVNNVEVTSGWTVDTTTGIITFEGGADFLLDFDADEYTIGPEPGAGATVRAGFEFDVPVRFQDEDLEVNVALVDAGSAPDITLVEVRR
ncbi:TIGR02217 family protein [Brucella abortus]|uniref:DUF2460 domain-containing protein n=1 Tax=Brucella abortus TaxID=235 RepID=UPI0004E871BD|nr:DUF2460 domain-containing protein [Brucella abortus]KFH18438.1 hypothetical protein IB60_17170 [Brucella abortus LMN1]RUQ67331.1 TIGR02217 family protein [Brucella abortus]RUQ77942.1 TIGR02217 family protein [Brucella abortus]RUQ88319.1 TIGR02217 family protein [Brucella abortus]RUQ90348.1 TIGR02217 family protein [Brucella abortus]